jgi:hypothetical protein
MNIVYSDIYDDIYILTAVCNEGGIEMLMNSNNEAKYQSQLIEKDTYYTFRFIKIIINFSMTHEFYKSEINQP